MFLEQEEYELNLIYLPAKEDVAAGLEINQLKLHNYLAIDTCPKSPQFSGWQSGRLEEIAVTLTIGVFFHWLSRKKVVLLCDTNDYKVFGKMGKYKRGLRHSKPASNP